MDLGGHQRFLKTAMYGMTSLLPDYLLLCVCPLAGLTRVTCEHFAIALALEIPVALVITKASISTCLLLCFLSAREAAANT